MHQQGAFLGDVYQQRQLFLWGILIYFGELFEG
jgi:hypothetical protein